MPETYGTLRAAFGGRYGLEVFCSVARVLGDGIQTIFDRSLYPDDAPIGDEFGPALAQLRRTPADALLQVPAD